MISFPLVSLARLLDLILDSVLQASRLRLRPTDSLSAQQELILKYIREDCVPNSPDFDDCLQRWHLLQSEIDDRLSGAPSEVTTFTGHQHE